ncbi:acyl carrier protein, partial [Streptomyces sp. SID10815]|uniref:acyl carrier protein n=1 Tax=Streptomyces sp. SID10815 TaxID=2706027 RepID=UPI0013C9A071
QASQPRPGRPQARRVPAGAGATALVLDRIAAVLEYPEGRRVEIHSTFKDLGFDSLMSVELRDALSTATGLPLPGGLLFDHPTPAALVAHLDTLLAGDGPQDDDLAPAPDADEPIAIVGMACR